ncbi:hypothetical protein CRM94_17330 [Burkholderia gladioli]|uniref:Uncharacterized protein n=1 Tax=Burkholderia gladioli TaxID=28095 RepID=A0A2A7SAZ9_BURGA|nr:hypothetical protein [Burkholderia gladioli]PEH40475.1 hypothetical protein CRM94_17330 [Burkholderia gladioli]
MAIKQTNSSSNTIYLEYSSTPGVLVVSNEATRKVLAEARKLVGEDAWKRGFDGLSGKSVAGQVRKFLGENGIPSSTVLDGELIAAYYSEREHANGVYQDIRLKLVDKENGEGYLVTLPLASSAGQLLVRKLANDIVARGTRISKFSVFPGNGRKDENTNRVYFDHSVQLKGDDELEIKQAEGVFNDGIAAVKAKLKTLEDAGFNDRDVLNKARAKAIVEFYKGVLVSIIEPKFPRESQGESDEPVSQPVSNHSYDEMDDSIPF